MRPSASTSLMSCSSASRLSGERRRCGAANGFAPGYSSTRAAKVEPGSGAVVRGPKRPCSSKIASTRLRWSSVKCGWGCGSGVRVPSGTLSPSPTGLVLGSAPEVAALTAAPRAYVAYEGNDTSCDGLLVVAATLLGRGEFLQPRRRKAQLVWVNFLLPTCVVLWAELVSVGTGPGSPGACGFCLLERWIEEV